ncbi:potassium/proton antiporter, CPA1 family [Peptoniphilus asaccharolyticus DSM 20463]|uniref:Potassium/proton antiporter, CPA1 family n=1 Tax=Peptoniphilus asaccharolyticus DSM 20463 TaxID=573058 RepID=A0A1W1UKE1_PEPAS|nr:potassium/proton antiporter, CPA1 family [Peptoniphilus asaccharolyticus DSM 20463]
MVAIVLMLALFAVRIADFSGIPSLLLFIFLGIAFNLMGFEFYDFEVSNSIATLALMIIMFYGGFSTNWSMGKPVWKESAILSTFGVFFTAILTGAFCHYVLRFKLLESMLLGSVIASTDYASVSSILVSKNLNFKYSTAPLLELESGSNDPTAYTMTFVFISLLAGESISVPILVLKQVGFGILIGFGMGVIVKHLIKNIHFDEDGLFTVFIAATMIATYSIAILIEGNGYLAIYLYGIYLGNQEFSRKRDVVFFYDGLGGLVQIGLFFLLGLLCNVQRLIGVFPVALVVMLFITLIARPFSVFMLMKPFKLKNNQLSIISIAGLRGAAAIAFAIMVVNSKVKVTIDIFHIVFLICLLSSFIQGSIMPILSKKLNMLEESDTVLKNFNFYQDKSDIGFIQTKIEKGSRWDNVPLKDFNLTFNLIVAKIERQGKTIVPNGETLIREGDIIVLGGQSYFDTTGSNLIEMTLSNGHKWVGKKIKDLEFKEKQLIVMLQTIDNKIIVPNGETYLYEGDKVVILKQNRKKTQIKK